MKNISIVVVVLVVIGGIVYYFKTQTQESTSSPESKLTPAGMIADVKDGQPIPETKISIKDFAFTPPTLNVKTGNKVTWINSDNVPHTVTSDTPNGPLKSPTLAPGESFSFAFTKSGTESYHCNFHRSMIGNVIVGE